jgi:predicted ribosome quality control (RQC) complex YloA/Tae2 family protein
MKTITYNDINIIVGQNSKENWSLLDTNENYLWFHLRSFPSCFVIIEDEDPDNLTVLEAATICKEHTKYRNLKNLKINYTHINNLRKVGKEGTVEFISNRKVSTITV